MQANDIAVALTSPLAYTPHISTYQSPGSASGSELWNTLVLGQNERGEWELFGNSFGGFGSAVSLSGSKSARGGNYAPVKPEQSAYGPLTIAEQVAKIRASLGLNVSELAQVFQVTRPTVYGWLKGIEPQPAAVDRLTRLLKVATVVSEKKFARIDLLVRRPIGEAPFNGASLLSMMASDSAVSGAHIELLSKLDQREASARAETKGLTQLRSPQIAIEAAQSLRSES